MKRCRFGGIGRASILSIPSSLIVILLTASSLWALSPQKVELSPAGASAHFDNRIVELARAVAAAKESPTAEAVALADEALVLLGRHSDKRVEMELRTNLSWILSRMGNPKRGLMEAEHVRTLGESLDDKLGTALAYYHIALARWYLCQTDQASQSVAHAIELLKVGGYKAELAKALTLAGAIHRSVSRYEQSVSSYLEALKIYEDVGDEGGQAGARNNIGLVYWDLDEHERALEQLLVALETYRKGASASRTATVLSNLGLIHCEIGQPKAALKYLNESLILHDRLDRPRSRARLLNNLGFAHGELGNEEEALKYTLASIDLREKTGDQMGLVRTYGQLAAIHRDAGRPVRAIDFFKKSLEKARSLGMLDEEAETERALAGVYESLGQFESALKSHRRFHEIKAKIDEDNSAAKIVELEAKYELAKKKRSLEALQHKKAEQELELSKQKVKQLWIAILAGGLLLGLIGVAYVGRTRARALAAERRSHETLRAASDRLAESEHRYKSVFDDTIVAKLVVDLEGGRLIDANKMALAFCGLQTESFGQLPSSELKPDWLAKEVMALSASSTAAHRSTHEWHEQDGSSKSSEFLSTPFLFDGRMCAVVSIRDVTQDLLREQEQVRLDRLESLGKLAGGIAHGFNNALGAVLGFVSLARMESNDEVDEILSGAETAIGKAERLTSELLTFSSGGKPCRELHNLAALIRESVTLTTTHSSVETMLRIGDDLWCANVDGKQIRQVIRNLVMNAVEACAEDGQIVVTAENVEPKSESESAFVRVVIRDNGHGIKADLREKVLDPYFSTREKGSGLGLPAAFGIVNRHGGMLEIESCEGEGTSVSLLIPADPSKEMNPAIDETIASRGEGRILVLEDDTSVQEVYRMALVQFGYDVEIVSDGRDAIRRWMDTKGQASAFDIVIMDLTIPGGIGGKAAMAELLHNDPQAIGVVVSGYSEDPVMSDFKQAGFQASLAKPFAITKLAEVVASAVSVARQSRSNSATA